MNWTLTEKPSQQYYRIRGNPQYVSYEGYYSAATHDLKIWVAKAGGGEGL